MKLVIAEKPSVAQNIADVLDAKRRQEGYLEGNNYLVSWCYGHLAGLSDPTAYGAQYEKWTLDTLPIFPEAFSYTIHSDKRRQFYVLRDLIRRSDVDVIVNACDAGREGELIFRTVYRLVGGVKPVQRLWISSMEVEAIREGFLTLHPSAEYDGLYASALCRSKADWLVGMNATRFFSVTYGRTLRVGRVMSPTLALAVQRATEIAAFTPEPFFTVVLDCGFPVSSERVQNRKDAEAIADACNGNAVVKSVVHQEKTEKPPALYDLTTLQRDANRLLGFTAQQTLDYLQALYEKKLCTYPRTDSRFLPEEMADSVMQYVTAAAAVCGMEHLPPTKEKQVLCSEKVTDHHAILPTLTVLEADLAALPHSESEVLRLLCLSVLKAVSLPHRYDETTVEVQASGYMFAAKGKAITYLGWKEYDRPEQNAVLPDLYEGQVLPIISAQIKTGKTTPPKPYTEDTMLAAMERADSTEEAERKGIGTPATRAGILEKLVSSGFLERRKRKKVSYLIPTTLGSALITVLPEQLQSPLLTAEWEQRLQEVERGNLAPEQFLNDIKEMLCELMKTYEAVPGTKIIFPQNHPVVGACPRCGASVIESQKGFFCERRGCKFGVWKDNRFFLAKRKQLTGDLMTKLLNGERVKLTGCWSAQKETTYDAVISISDDGSHTTFDLEFDRRSS